MDKRLGLVVTLIFIIYSCSSGKHIETWICKEKSSIQNGTFYRFESLSGNYGRERIWIDSFACKVNDTIKWKIVKGIDYIQK